jgi:hypothetical protein
MFLYILPPHEVQHIAKEQLFGAGQTPLTALFAVRDTCDFSARKMVFVCHKLFIREHWTEFRHNFVLATALNVLE